MAGEGYPVNKLTPRQAELLEVFRALGPTVPNETAGQVHVFDQAVSAMKEALAKRGADISDQSSFFSVLAGLNIGATWTLGLLEREPDFTVADATNVLEVALDRLAPDGQQRFEAPVVPAHTAWYDQASSYVRDLLTVRMQLDITDPDVFGQITAGMSVGVESMAQWTKQGYDVNDAALRTCAVLAHLAPAQT